MALELVDPVPGNIGLVKDEDTVILLHFTEPDGVHPSDAAGTLEDLAAADSDAPAVSETGAFASAVTRAFTDGAAFVAADKDGASSLLTRDVSVQAIISFAADSATGSWTVICRGRGPGFGTEAEFVAFEVRVSPSFSSQWFLHFVWADLAGSEETVSSEGFTPPAIGAPTLLTWTRRRESSTSVVCRFYVGDTLISEATSAVGDIGGGTTGQTSIGARHFDPGGWDQFLEGNLDELKVVSREMSHEEIRETWARLAKHQPDGVTALRGQSPPGAIWAKDDGSDIGRIFKAGGSAIGYAAAKAHELRNTFLPDAAYKDTIGRWERLVGLQRREQLALDTRRDRVVSRLQVENGYSVPKVKAVLATPFDVDEADVNIVEFSPTIEESFTGPDGSPPDVQRWHIEGAGWSILSNLLQIDLAAGADLRWDAAPPAPDHVRMVVDNGDDPVGLIAQVKLATYWTALPANTIVGLFIYNFRTNDALWFGVKNDGGTRKLGYVTAVDGVLGAFTALVDPSTDAAYYLRVTKTQLGYLLYWSTISFEAGTTAGLIGGVAEPEYAGVGAMCTDAATGAQLTATFDDFLARMPDGKRAFHWYAYRDPGDPGSPDMEDADRIVQRIKPAHTVAAAVQSLSLLCDNDTGLCDHTPLGGL